MGSRSRTRQSSFADWVGEKGALEYFNVVNHFLGSSSRGVRYRNTPDMRDSSSKVSLFGSVVRGIRVGADWVKVGQLFLPVSIDRKVVLAQAQDTDSTGFSDEEEEIWKRSDIHPILANKLQRDYLLQKSRAEYKRRRESRAEMQRPKLYYYDNQSEFESVMLQHGQDLSETGSIRDGVPFPTAGKGALYEVVANKAAIAAVFFKHSEKPPTKYFFTKGEYVELFDWDPSKQRRQFLYTLNQEPMTGWVQLDYYGPLLRPVGCKEKWTRLDPLFTALYENNAEHLRRMIEGSHDLNIRDDAGYTPLMNSARWDAYDCAVLLLVASVDTEIKDLTTGRTAAEMGSQKMLALIEALSGAEVFNALHFEEALQELTPEVQRVAENKFDRIAGAKRESRQCEETIMEKTEGDLHKEFLEMQAKVEAMKAQLAAKARELEGPVASEPLMFNIAEDESDVGENCDGGANSDMEGDLYQVVLQNIRIRERPTPNSEVVGMRKRGQVLRLFEPDPTCEWRRTEMGTNPTIKEPRGHGWVLLNHTEKGALVEPFDARGQYNDDAVG